MTAAPGHADEARRCLRFGWTSLAAWATFGLALEAAHGFKLALFLDDDVRHTLLRLAHAHGVVLALVVLVYGGGVASLYEATARQASRVTGALLRAGAAAIPVGFATAAIHPHESDPGLPIVLVPLGGLLLLAGLIRAVMKAHRGKP